MKLEMEVKLVEISREELAGLLSGFNTLSVYWVDDFIYDKKEYAKAKKELKKTMDEDDICVEHVWAQMLATGSTFTVKTNDGETKKVNINDIKHAIETNIAQYGMPTDSDEWDQNEYGDEVMQIACFESVIYG